MQPVYKNCDLKRHSEASSLRAVASKVTDVVEQWSLETGCGYGSTHGDWLSDNMHQISQEVAHLQ